MLPNVLLNFHIYSCCEGNQKIKHVAPGRPAFCCSTWCFALAAAQDDWIEVLAAAESDQQAHAGHGAKGGTTPKPGAGSTSPKPGGDGEGKAKGGEEEVAVTRSFGATPDQI